MSTENALAPLGGDHAPEVTTTKALAIIADLIDSASLDELEGIAATHGADLSDILALLQTDDGRRLAAAAREQSIQAGEMIQHKARRTVNVGLDRVLAALRDPETSPSTLTRLVEIASRLSGLTEERAAKLRTAGVGAGAPFLNLAIIDADEELPEPRPGELRLTIVRPAGAFPRREKVIEQETTDVEAE